MHISLVLWTLIMMMRRMITVMMVVMKRVMTLCHSTLVEPDVMLNALHLACVAVAKNVIVICKLYVSERAKQIGGSLCASL